MNRSQKVTVSAAFVRMAAAFQIRPKTLAKLVLKEFEENPPPSITLHRVAPVVEAVDFLASAGIIQRGTTPSSQN